MNIRIAPSILAADLACLGEEISRAAEGGCDTFHLDIMDWHFVPNLSYGPHVVAAVRRLTDLPLDVHLMVDNPLDMIEAFADAGSDYITVHVEAPCPMEEAFEAITAKGVRPGITMKPDRPVGDVIPYLGDVDLCLVMSVFPGFGGQAFIEESYGRIRAVADAASGVNPDLIISVDGGVGIGNAARLIASGANYLVAGTAVFRNHGARENVRLLRGAAEGA